MTSPHSIHSGAIRFSLTSEQPLPAGLVAHTISSFTEAFGEPEVSHPIVGDLDSLSLFVADSLSRVTGEMRAELRGPALALAVDCALTEGALAAQGPRLVVTDVDSTFVRGEVIEMLAAAAGSEEMVREITSAAMRGELDFAQSLEKRVATLEGVPSRVFDDVAAIVPVTPGADSLIAALHARGGYIGLVSGGFHEVVDQIAQPRGIDEVLANRLMVADGRLLGRTYGRIIDRQAKREALLQWSSVRGIPLDQTVAVGDGANDLGMMEAAGLSVAFCAKPVVLEQADAAITTARLDKLVALFGWTAQ